MKRYFKGVERKAIFLSLSIVVPVLVNAQKNEPEPVPLKTSSGMMINLNGQNVELAVAKNAAFLISIRHAGTPGVIPSAFIVDDRKEQAKFSIVSRPPVYGIKTNFGELVINTQTKRWSLFDGKGKLLIQESKCKTTDTLQEIDIKTGGQNTVYGSGNHSTKDLIKHRSDSELGNGTADIPYLWNSVGFGALGITENDNHPAQWKTNESSIQTWSFKGIAANLYIWPAKNLYESANIFSELTGKSKLPPKWAFGYQQSQWGWRDSVYIDDVVSNFRTRHLPVDAFIYDFEWYTTTPDYSIKKNGQADFSDFEFNPQLFPSPIKQIADYKNQGIKFIGIRKPRLGNTARLDLARKNGWLIQPESESRDLDFSNELLRQWYAAQNKTLLEAGVDAWWNDEGESYYTCYYWWNQAQMDLRSSIVPNNRHFSINRSFSPGNQRFGYCTWNGDITSTWKALRETPADLLNFSLSGMIYGSCDIGGFQGTPSKENLVRWFQAGVFFPIMRAHSNIMTTPRFPWLWGTDGEDAIRKAINLRYQLLPLLYSLGHEAYNTGAPIMRPLLMEFEKDTIVANLTDEWLLGKGLLAAPVLDSGGTRTVYLPDDIWYDYHTGKVIHGPAKFVVNKALEEIPVYVRGGTILPIGPVLQHTGEQTNAPLEIHIYPGRDGSFKFTEDDGQSYNYTKGEVRMTTFTWKDSDKTLHWNIKGNYTGKNVAKIIKVVLGDQVKTTTLNKSGSVRF